MLKSVLKDDLLLSIQFCSIPTNSIRAYNDSETKILTKDEFLKDDFFDVVTGQAIREQFHTWCSESGFRPWINRRIRSFTGTDRNCSAAIDCCFCPAHQRQRPGLRPTSGRWRASARTEHARQHRVRSRLLLRGFVDTADPKPTEYDRWGRNCRNTRRHQRRTWGQSGGHDPNSPDASSLIAGRNNHILFNSEGGWLAFKSSTDSSPGI